MGNQFKGDRRTQTASVAVREHQTKLELAVAINDAIRERRLHQAQAATLLQIPQPKISALANYRLNGFSVERLLRLLNGLGRDIVIQVHKKKTNGIVGKTSVNAA